MRRLLIAAALGAVAVLTIAPVPAVAAPGPPDAPEYWFDQWNVPGLWASGARGQGITIAEIDTGVDVLPQLQGKVLSGTDFGSAGGNGQTDRDDSQFGHGTAMASIMVADAGPFGITGLAPDAKILPIAVPLADTQDAGAGYSLGTAIRYAVDHGAKIVNMSLGGDSSGTNDSSPCNDEEQAAIYYALQHDVIVTAAVGNDGTKGNQVEDPAVCLGVVAVAAVDSHGNVADFSTRQPYVTLAAPGVAVPSLSRVVGAAYSGDGTSQATALTSASFALIWSKFPDLRGPQVVARVLDTLDGKLGSPSTSIGYGVLNTGAAVRDTVPADAPDPVQALAQPFVDRSTALGRTAGPPPVKLARGGSLGRRGAAQPPGSVVVASLTGVGIGVLGLLIVVIAVLVWRRGRRAAGVPDGPYPPDGLDPAVPYPQAGSPGVPSQPPGAPSSRPLPGYLPPVRQVPPPPPEDQAL